MFFSAAMIASLRAVPALVLLTFLVSASAQAQVVRPPGTRRFQPPAFAHTRGILFVRLKLSYGELTLLGTTARPGTFRTHGHAGQSRSVRVIGLDVTGREVGRWFIPDPTVSELEYSSVQGLQKITSSVDIVEFEIRVPAIRGLHLLALDRPRAPRSKGGFRAAIAEPVERIGEAVLP